MLLVWVVWVSVLATSLGICPLTLDTAPFYLKYWPLGVLVLAFTAGPKCICQVHLNFSAKL